MENKKSFPKAFIVLIIFTLFTGKTAWAWDGSGTQASPYLIKTTDDLVTLATNSQFDTYNGKFFRLENDLNMNGIEIGTIGCNGASFGGTFDGNGHTIRNLTISKPNDNRVGLFGIINSDCTIRNLIIDQASITGYMFVGVLVGETSFQSGTIENCCVINSSVTSNYTSGTFAGIISGIYWSAVNYSGNCYWNCSVTIGSNEPVTTDIATNDGDKAGAVGPNTWTALQTVLSNASTDANNPTVITLTNNITATGSDTYLEIPYGHHVILDLNGHTIDRALTEATSNGFVIKVNENSTLTIRDSAGGGTITGGWIDYGTASCISFQGKTLRLEGGTISGNRSNHYGGAISFKNDFFMTGGTITGNWSNMAGDYGSNMCGQVFFNNIGNFYFSGGAITGNRCGNTAAGSAGIGLNNASSTSRTVHLSGTYTLSGNEQGNYNSATGEWTDLSASDILNSGNITYVIDGAITPTPSASRSAMILNTSDGGTKATFTSGWSTYMDGKDPEDYFTLTNPNGQGIGLNASGEATIGDLHTISLADGLTASTSQAVQGKIITLSGANAPTTINGITYTTDYIVSYNDGEAHAVHYTADVNGHATFLMPHADATVNIAAGAITVTYINENGEEEICTEFTIVDSDHPLIVTGNSSPKAHLGENNKEHWYAVSGTVSLSSDLRIHGNTRIILCDGATFNVYAPLRGDTDSDLTIYGQPQGTGTLNVATAYNDAISLSSLDITVNGGNVNATTTDDGSIGIYNVYDHILTINRGTVTVTGKYGLHITNANNLALNDGTLIARGSRHAIHSFNNIIINGGNIDAKGQECALFSNQDIIINGGIVDAEAQTCAIYSDNGDIAILGGKVTATDDNNVGIKTYGNHTITLGFTNLTDRITASNYVCATLKVADGQILYDGSAYYGGTLDNNQLTSIAGKTLQPFVPTGVVLQENTPGVINATFSGTSLDTVNIPAPITVQEVTYHRTFTAGKASTVMLPFDYTCNGNEGGTFYRFVGVEKENSTWLATMQSTADALTANTPYLFLPTETSVTFTIPNQGVTLCTTGGGGGQTADAGSHWTFKGTYDYKEWIADGANSDEIGKVYGFAGVAQDGINVGDFVKIASGAKIRPMSAYLIWNNTANLAPARGGMNASSASADKLPQSITVRLLGADGTVTNVGEIDMETGEVNFDGWYTLQGVKLNAEPTEPGIYINNGKKVSITH